MVLFFEIVLNFILFIFTSSQYKPWRCYSPDFSRKVPIGNALGVKQKSSLFSNRVAFLSLNDDTLRR